MDTENCLTAARGEEGVAVLSQKSERIKQRDKNLTDRHRQLYSDCQRAGGWGR